MDAGFADAGVRTVLACEIDRTAAATWRRNFGEGMHAGDVRGLLPHLEAGAADIVFGGPPCQGYSVAGKMDPSDPRSTLVYAFLEAVGRVAPRAFVMENVDALARLAKWRGTLEDIRGRATAIGYATHVEVLDAADYCVPQARRRMFMWGVRRGDEGGVAAAVTATLAGLRTERKPSRTVFERLGPAGTPQNPATSGAAISFCRNPVLRPSPWAGMLFNGAGRPVNPDTPAPTMAASAGGNKTHIVDERHVFGGGPAFAVEYRRRLADGLPPFTGKAPDFLRRLTLREAAAFQTFPEGFAFEGSNSSAYRQIGNAVPCALARAAALAARAAAGANIANL